MSAGLKSPRVEVSPPAPRQRRTRWYRPVALAAVISVGLLILPDVVDAQTWQPTSGKPIPRISTESPTFYWPAGEPVDDAIPTPSEFFGFDIGFRHLDHAQVVAYIRAVAESSDRVTVDTYATSHGGRPLLMATITDPKRRDQLSQIRADHRKLATAASGEVDLSGLPAVINMGYGVHGDESSATNCAPLVVYYLAASRAPRVQQWLENCVILLDPCLNPDGFDRFANWSNRYRGIVPNPDPQHAEHNQQWPPGRVNYYWFDLNRDWLPAVHPESRGRLRNYHRWKPNVVLDFHEMGSGSTYFFQPGIPERTNPLTPARNQVLTREFSRFHAQALDQQHRLYFTQERFDDFYMGKGSTYPDLHGSVGILFEQASARGHVQSTADGLLRFHDTIANQFTTSLTSLQATTQLRTELHRLKRDFYQEALEMAAQQPVETFVFTAPHNLTRLDRFAELLDRHDIESYWLKRDIQIDDQTFDAHGSLVVPVRQPEYRFLKSLLMRRKRFRENIFYDVSSWTLPLAYGVRQHGLQQEIPAEDRVAWQPPAKRDSHAFPSPSQENAIGYLVDYRDDAAVELLARLLRADVKVRVAMKPVTVATADGPKSMPRGSLSIVLANQPGKRNVIERLLDSKLAGSVSILPVMSGLSVRGPDLGSPNFPLIQPPRWAMLIGPSQSAYGSGEVWHSIDQVLKMPLTMIMERRWDQADLSEYSAVVLAGGSLDDDQWQSVSEFARQGGTVVVTGNQAVAVQRRMGLSGSDSGDNAVAGTGDGLGSVQQPFDSASNKRALQLISGAIFNTHADLTHPLTFGLQRADVSVFRNHSGFLRPSDNVYANPLVYVRDQPLLAGYCSDDNVERFKSSASVVIHEMGRGRFVLMADNPNFRGFWQATRRMFFNALLLGDKMDP